MGLNTRLWRGKVCTTAGNRTPVIQAVENTLHWRSYHRSWAKKSRGFHTLHNAFHAPTKGNLWGLDIKRIEPVCFDGCKSLHLGDRRRTQHFLRRLVLVQKFSFASSLAGAGFFFCKGNRVNSRNNKCINVQPEYKRSFFNTFSNNSLSCHAMLHIIIHLRNDRLHVSAQYIQNSNTCRKGNQSGTCSLNRSQYFRCTSWATTHPTFRATQRRKRWSCPPNLLFN